MKKIKELFNEKSWLETTQEELEFEGKIIDIIVYGAFVLLGLCAIMCFLS